MPAWRARTFPDRDGSITKHTVSGPMNTQSQNFAGCAHVPASVAGEISAPCRASPVTREFMLRPDAYRSVSSIAVNPFVNRPFPAAFGGPGAITVKGPGQRHSLL